MIIPFIYTFRNRCNLFPSVYKALSVLFIAFHFSLPSMTLAGTSGQLEPDKNLNFDCPVSILGEIKKEDYYSVYPLHNEYLATHIYENGQIIYYKSGEGVGRIDAYGQFHFKHGWHRKVGGDFKVTGRRLDRSTEKTLSYTRPDFPTNKPGGMVGQLIFPSPGCWEVTGYVGDQSLTFVVEVLYK